MSSKRHYERGATEHHGKGKWPKSAGFYSQNKSLKTSSGSFVFRILCHVSKIGSIIGKGGKIISQIRQQTNAKVKLEEAVVGCDERIIAISGSNKKIEINKDLGKDIGKDAKESENNDDNKQIDDSEEYMESVPIEDLQSEKVTPSVHKALLLVFERMLEGETEINGADEENNMPSTCIVRLLVFSNQVGCILGKGGSVIKQMSATSGAQIRILPREKTPACASSSDELVQITGDVGASKKALQLLSQQLLDNPVREPEHFPENFIGPLSHPVGHYLHRTEVFPPPNFPYHTHDDANYHSVAPSLDHKFYEGIHGRINSTQDIVSFQLLCHHEKIGSIIGKGGAMVRTVQVDTGCEIKILDGVSDSDDRIIVISGPAHPDDRISAAQEGVLRVQSRIFKPTSDNSFENSAVARILVSSHQIGCLLGKGGSIIAEMRKSSGAQIRILGRELIPMCVSENEEVVQMNGSFAAVQEALLQITSRLRHNFFRDMLSSNTHYPDHLPPFPSYMGRMERSPPGMYSNFGPFHKFDVHGGLPPHSGFNAHEDRSPFMHNIHRSGMPQISEWRPSSGPRGSQGLTEGGGPIGSIDYPGAPQRRNAGPGGIGQPATITNTTVEVVVPRSLVPTINGEEGENLEQIRQISDAKVTITEPKPGATETIIIISGTPEQTHAAQSLIQAFVMSGTATP